MVQVGIDFADEHFDASVRPDKLVAVRRGPAAPVVVDFAAAVRQALEEPLEFPPLRRALTPDDRVAVVVSEESNRLAELLTPLLGHLAEVGLDLGKITLICPPRWPDAPAEVRWINELLPTLRNLAVEVHDPTDRRKLSYLATTKAGRRIYLNRTLVDADQLIVVGSITYDPVLGYGGGLGDVFPWLSDDATRIEFLSKTTASAPGDKVRPARQEAQEVGWLLGMPFLLQVVEGHGEDISHVLGGSCKGVGAEGRRRINEQWRVTVDRSADLVLAGISGRQSFANVTRALACATRAVRPGGKIVVLSRAAALGPSAAFMRQEEDPAKALALVRQHKLPDAINAWQLATAVQHAKLYLLSAIPPDTVEDLFMTPLEGVSQVQRLVDAAESCLVLPDAHRTLAVSGEW